MRFLHDLKSIRGRDMGGFLKVLKIIRVLLAVSLLVGGLSGCNKNFALTTSGDSSMKIPAPPPGQTLQMDSVTAHTKKNQPVTFTAGTVNGQIVGLLSFSSTPGDTSHTTANGRFQILDPATFSIEYTPDQNFVGADSLTVYATDSYGDSVSAQVSVIVGNTLNTIQPALVVRGMSCITCHSSVSSNIVTDYGFGNSWYFDTVSPDSFYFDRDQAGNGLSTLSLLQNSEIIVPTANVPAAIQSQFNVTTLAEFVQARFAQGSTNLSSQVREIQSLTINVPTASRIQQLFGNPTANFVYLPDTSASPALSGLNFDNTNHVFMIKNLVCDGDLYLGATVMFNNATVQSVNGCRIYATGSIFIDTPIQSKAYNGSTNYNTQLLSAISIWMGTGKIIQNGAFCETSNGSPIGWYASSGSTEGVDCTSAANVDQPACDTLTQRAYQTLARNTYTRAYATPSDLKALLSTPLDPASPGTVLQARANVEASLGHSLVDAACEPGGRANSISRLMLVAPYVQNRYSGTFSGSTVAEAALMSLGTFTYQFDPVFTKVSIFSLLDSGELLSGQGL